MEILWSKRCWVIAYIKPITIWLCQDVNRIVVMPSERKPIVVNLQSVRANRRLVWRNNKAISTNFKLIAICRPTDVEHVSFCHVSLILQFCQPTCDRVISCDQLNKLIYLVCIYTKYISNLLVNLTFCVIVTTWCSRVYYFIIVYRQCALSVDQLSPLPLVVHICIKSYSTTFQRSYPNNFV